MLGTLRYARLGRVPFERTLSTQEELRREIIAAKNRLRADPTGGGGAAAAAAAAATTTTMIPHTLFSYEVAHPTYTFGRRYRDRVSASERARLEGVAPGAVVRELPRGGHATFHGPGQLVMYPVLDLQSLRLRVRDYVCLVERSVVAVLRAQYGIDAEQRAGAGLNGVWLRHTNEKIAFVGISASRSVTQFGLALNVDVDRRFFRQIVPCNLSDVSVVSIADVCGSAPPITDVSDALASELAQRLNLDLRTR